MKYSNQYIRTVNIKNCYIRIKQMYLNLSPWRSLYLTRAGASRWHLRLQGARGWRDLSSSLASLSKLRLLQDILVVIATATAVTKDISWLAKTHFSHDAAGIDDGCQPRKRDDQVLAFRLRDCRRELLEGRPYELAAGYRCQ